MEYADCDGTTSTIDPPTHCPTCGSNTTWEHEMAAAKAQMDMHRMREALIELFQHYGVKSYVHKVTATLDDLLR